MSEQKQPDLTPIFVMGKRYMVPDSLTIMKALEYAGYTYTRGCGCRGGICGACATYYRTPGDYRIKVGLACQTVVEPDMYVTQLPFFPANRAVWDIEASAGDYQELHNAYPELFRCVACNACTKVCPMDIQVMDYVGAMKRGDLALASRLSFDCIQCGLCASRCMGELPQYHMAQMARRMVGAKLTPRAAHAQAQVDKVASGYFTDLLSTLKAMSASELKEAYKAREMEPHTGPDEWTPDDSIGL